MSSDLAGIQSDLRAAKLDGWLFYDFRGRDPIAQRILQLPEAMRTRRWFYFVPAKGAPKKLVHKIEGHSLEALPGETLYYASQEELPQGSEEVAGPREERGHAILAEERDSVRGHGGCRHDRIGAQRRSQGGQFGGPGAEIRSLLERGAA